MARIPHHIGNYYNLECECCGGEFILSGGYIGLMTDLYCEKCGFEGEYCGMECDGDCEGRDAIED